MQTRTFHASPIARRQPAIARILLCATVVGVLMSFTGVFGLGDDPPVIRTVYVVVANWIGAALAMLAYEVALRVAWARGRFWVRVLIANGLLVVPSGVLVWASSGLFGRGFDASTLPIYFLNAFVISGAFIAAFVAPAMDAALRREDAAPAAGRGARFWDRLPDHLRDGELWALKAEDHYLRAITSRGEALIRLRMADALRELESIEGAQTHRSWWVARAAVRGVRRGVGPIALVLPDGREASVSRACARNLRAAGWF